METGYYRVLPCGEPLPCGGDITVQLPYTVINVWRGITVWELLTCETSHQSEILHSLIFDDIVDVASTILPKYIKTPH